MSSLVWVYRQIDARGEWPAQATFTQIALLPKSLDSERPICPSAVGHHGTAPPQEMASASKRPMPLREGHAERDSSQRSSVKVSSFSKGPSSSTLNISMTPLTGRDLQLPAVIMHHAMVIHAAPRWLCAEGQADKPFHTQYSITAGCPFSVALAKVYLWKTCKQLYRIHPSLVVSSWVDDLSADMVGKSPQYVAKTLAKVLAQLGTSLDMNPILGKNKSGFLVSSNELKKALQEALPKDSPTIQRVLKDLGCDSTGGRLRRLPTQKARFQRQEKTG